MAASGLLVLHLDPPDYGLLPQAMNPLLIAYLVFAVAILVREWLGLASPRRYDWIDLAWILVLTAATGGTSSVLFFMLLLPIISRAFREGFESGWRMTLITTTGLLAFGLPAAPGGAMFEFNRALIRPLTLLILGYVLAREGGAQRRAQHQLELLAGINAVGNPRFGSDRTLLDAARRIRQSYAVRECLILLRREVGEPAVLARAASTDERVESLPDAAASMLLQLPPNARVLHQAASTRCAPESGADLREQCLALSDVLGGRALVSVPLRRAEQTVGRLYLVDDALPQFDLAELAFLERAGVQLMLIVERTNLLDRLALVASQRERRRLAHDLHDLAIQPYLGVQLGLSAALRRTDCPEALAEELRGLQRLAQQGVSELRGILDAQRAETSSENVFATALTRLVAHYREHFGIQIEIQKDPDLQIGDRLAGDVLAMISEGLSNVRRHTAATQARVALACKDEQLHLTLSNPNAGAPAASFVPKSISTRVRELGGDLALDTDRDGCTVLTLRIPL